MELIASDLCCRLQKSTLLKNEPTMLASPILVI
jgi:hypothetical protein